MRPGLSLHRLRYRHQHQNHLHQQQNAVGLDVGAVGRRHFIVFGLSLRLTLRAQKVCSRVIIVIIFSLIFI